MDGKERVGMEVVILEMCRGKQGGFGRLVADERLVRRNGRSMNHRLKRIGIWE